VLCGLNIMISVTGNYGFFNMHYITLCIPFVEDRVWFSAANWLLGTDLVATTSSNYIASYGNWALPAFHWSVLVNLPLLVMIMIGSLQTLNRAFRTSLVQLPQVCLDVYRKVVPFYVLNSYGLFAVMTTKRIELVIEGSNDGETWLPYEFKYKPGNVNRPPPLIPGHMPRLDWRLWFCPFSHFPNIPDWMIPFLQQILKGNKAVLSLLQSVPFEEPPKLLRVMRYDYHFTDRQTLRDSKQWWTRTPKGLYIPYMLSSKKTE